MSDEPAEIVWPKRSDYPDAHEYTEARTERLRNYVDVRNRHRQGSIGTMSTQLAELANDLARGSAPGWVQSKIDGLRDDVDRLDKTAAGNRTLLITTLVSVVLLLIALVGNLLRGGAL